MNARERRAARHQPAAAPEPGPRPRRATPITPARVVDTALELIAADGFEAVTMRRVAAALDTGPASLYAHVVNKADLDELLIARLCADLRLPEPDRETWRDQVRDVCGQLRDRFLAYPGISRAALAMLPTDLETMRVNEGLLAILLAGGVPAQPAAWAIDALLLYVAAYCLEISLVDQRRSGEDGGWLGNVDEVRRRLAALPVQTFPHTVRHAAELTSGTGHERFDFTLTLMIDGLNRD